MNEALPSSQSWARSRKTGTLFGDLRFSWNYAPPPPLPLDCGFAVLQLLQVVLGPEMRADCKLQTLFVKPPIAILGSSWC